MKYRRNYYPKPDTIADQVARKVSCAIDLNPILETFPLTMDQIRLITRRLISALPPHPEHGTKFVEVHYFEDNQWWAEFHFTDDSKITYGEDEL